MVKCILGAAFALLMLADYHSAQAKFKVLHSFSGGNDSCSPDTGLTLDGAGNLYGVAPGIVCNSCGTVFKVAPDGTESPLYNFTCGNNGEAPDTALYKDRKGNLYGATNGGGSIGCGVIFKVWPDGNEETVHDFAGPPNDGCTANGPLLIDRADLYDTTAGGGTGGDGTVFKLASGNAERVLYSFCHKIDCADGSMPLAGLIADGAQNLYGTTVYGGGKGGFGAVFEFALGGGERVLYRFKGSPNDGEFPEGALLADNTGDLYGTLAFGGRAGCLGNLGCGAVFKLTPDGKETVLHFFSGNRGDGGNPIAGLITDGAGNLYGTAPYGGSRRCIVSKLGCGIVFELAPDGTETVLHSFGTGADGANPAGSLVRDKRGNFYGTTGNGGKFGYGTVFEITP